MERNHCQKINGYDKNNEPILKLKNKYGSLDIAIRYAKRYNLTTKQDRKLVAYKCTVCHQYHIGRGETLITEKYRKKLKKEASTIKFKVVGKIEL
jgi:hypothetical protein